MNAKFPTKNDLSENIRDKVIETLNGQLGDGIILSLQAKQAHWNVRGPVFFQLHELFDKVYDDAVEWSDLLAERVAQLGGTANGTLESLERREQFPKYDRHLVSGKEHITALANSLAAFAKNIRISIKEVEDLGDAGSADLFTEISRGVDKNLWLVEAHLHAES